MKTLLQLKIDFEQYLVNNYTETEVHYAGMDFNPQTYNEWIYFEYQGSSVSDFGLDSTEAEHNGNIKVVSIALTPFRATQIADKVLSLFSSTIVAGMIPKTVYISSQGYDKELSKSYIELDIQIGSV